MYTFKILFDFTVVKRYIKSNKKALELIQDFIKRKNAPNHKLGTLHII